MRIGQVARATGLTTKTIRFYESQGLLRDPGRTPSGYRVYSAQDVERLRFVQQAKSLGLSLREVRGILGLYDRRDPTCVHVRSLLDDKIASVDQLIRDLTRFRTALRRLRNGFGTIDDCRPSGGRICAIIEQSGVELGPEVRARLEKARPSRRGTTKELTGSRSKR